MRSIHERPFPPEDRGEAGHWEGDLIIGKDQQSTIGTLVERQTRLVRLLHLRRPVSPRCDVDWKPPRRKLPCCPVIDSRSACTGRVMRRTF